MLAESKKFFSFVKVGPTRCEDQMVGFHNGESAHPGGWVELGGPSYYVPADIIVYVVVLQVAHM